MEKLSYTYRFADGTSCTVFFGEDGVRRKDILRLQRMDHAEELQERYKLAHTDYRFRNAMLRYQKHTTEMKSSPIDWIVDEKADIWEQLYGENGYKGDDYGAPFFCDGQSLFNYSNLREVLNFIRNTDLNYGFLPAPKLDERQEEYKTVATDVYWGIPLSCVSQLEMIGTVTEALSCQHYNYVRPAFFETTMKTKLSYSEDDSNMLDIAASNLNIDFGFAYQSSISAMGSLDDFINDGVKSDSVASTFEKKRSSLEKGLEKVIAKYEELP